LKLLFDQNLAPSLVRRLADEYPDSAHTFPLGLGEADDRAIWDYARDHGFAIVSKDSDFHQLSVREGPPPKVVWVRLGNCTVDDIETILRERQTDLERLDAGPEAFLVIGTLP
jgi:predicted nuclease of predicted toxin-antitoxin system